MDLSSLDMKTAASRGAVMTLRHPATGEDLTSDDGQPITIEVLGSDSAEYRNKLRQVANQRMNSRKKQSVEQLEQESVSILVSATKGWRGIVVNGEQVEFSPEAARRLYMEYPWIREQVDEFVGERSNFLMSA